MAPSPKPTRWNWRTHGTQIGLTMKVAAKQAGLILLRNFGLGFQEQNQQNMADCKESPFSLLQE